MRYNEEVAVSLDFTLEDDYVLSKIEDMQNTTIIRDGDLGSFSFNLTDLFIRCPMVFKRVEKGSSKDQVLKIYDSNKKKFQKMLKGALGKAITRDKVVRTKDGNETYYKFNKTTMTVLKNGYPKKVEVELTDIEKYVMAELNMFTLTKGISTQIKNMDEVTLKEAIQVAKETGIHDFPYVRSIYNNLMQSKKADNVGSVNDLNKNKTSNSNCNNSVPQNVPKSNKQNKPRTKFHNCNESFTKFTPDDLEKHLLEMQKDKFK
ncbi:MAG: hypothetical protein ACRC18_06885 [Cetobacterium sp.]